MRGLHDHRRRILDGFQPREHAHAIEFGHHEVEHHRIDLRLRAIVDALDRLLPALHRLGLIAEAAHHLGEQATLDGIVIDDEKSGAHEGRSHFRFGLRRRRRCFVLARVSRNRVNRL